MSHTNPTTTTWRDYLTLCKPRVVLLMLITAYVGMHLSTVGMVPLVTASLALIGIALMASSAAVINHLIDARIDSVMARTQHRPIASGKIPPLQALLFSLTIGVVGFVILWGWVNTLTAILTFITLIGYAIIYTMFLKRTTPQNIVIGGLAGAMPPLLGWTAITGTMDLNGWLLVAIIFVWTPPHFWALAIYRYNEYKKVPEIPMLPVTHGIAYTKNAIIIYTVLLLIVSCLPYVVGMSGVTYLIGVVVLGLVFLYYAILLKRHDNPKLGRDMFRYSIIYLFLLFILLFIDHFIFNHFGW